MIAITINTTSWRSTDVLGPNEVEFTGEFLYEPNGLTPAMVWDDKLGNVRAMNEMEREVRARALIKPVTRRQMLTALHRSGLLATIKSAVAASADVELQIAFDESQEFQRTNPFLASMAAALGKTDAEIDAVFALAATL